jgi:signal transduction histidine kinase/CheY-like chemotaxis protein
MIESSYLEDLKKQASLSNLLMELANGFINLPVEYLNDAILASLNKMASFVDVDRSYIFKYDWESNTASNSHEWCNTGIEPQIDNLQEIPNEMMQAWVDAHKKGIVISIPDVLGLPEEDEARQQLEPQGIQSLLAVPLMNGSQCIGFVGFDSVRNKHVYSEVELNILNMFAQMLANVSMRKEMVEQLIVAKEKAEESDRLKSAFLANMSHEIRTPMNGIMGFAQLLKDPKLNPDNQGFYIQMIEKSGTRMLNIINDIIDISKIESGTVEIRVSEFSIKDQFEFLYLFFKPEADSKGLALKYTLNNSDSESNIFTDRDKFYAIMSNLIKNAIKYTSKGAVEFGCKVIENEMEFYVKDTGIGIAADRKEAVFGRFVQADIADVMARQGAGLGLSISKAYADMMKGQLSVESTEELGSTFILTLPKSISDNTTTVSTSNEVAGELNSAIPLHLKVIIVEDDPLSEMLLEIEMKRHGYEIVKARTGLEAVEACKEHTDAKLVLMDIGLPEINGYEATKRIRAFNDSVVIMAQTAFGLSDDQTKAYQSGCNEFISKPINMAVLQSLIAKHFS